MKIKQFYRILSVLQSKQRPRKIVIFGNDNNKYDFLLMGEARAREV